jgi:hypothetical protein
MKPTECGYGVFALEWRSCHLLSVANFPESDEFDKVASSRILARRYKFLDVGLMLLLKSRLFRLGASRE